MNTQKTQEKLLKQKESTTAQDNQKLQNKNPLSLSETLLEQDEMGLDLVIQELTK